MAAAYLQERDIPLRNFPQVLQSMYPGATCSPGWWSISPALARRKAGLLSSPWGKKAHNWLSGRNVPANREDYFRSPFALGLGESQLNTLLGLFTDYCIQYRDGRELVFAWFLRHGYGYLDALRFLRGPAHCPGMERLEPGRNSQLTHELAQPVPAYSNHGGASSLLPGEPGIFRLPAPAGLLLFPRVPRPAHPPCPLLGRWKRTGLLH